MIDLRNYKDLIRELVAKENEKDKNWRWSVKSITKTRVRIRWGYLDYLEEKENCFIIDLRRWTKGYTIKQPNMDCQPTEITALMRHRAVFS